MHFGGVDSSSDLLNNVIVINSHIISRVLLYDGLEINLDYKN